jgi:riboflavin synthase
LFTGLIEETGKIIEIGKKSGQAYIRIQCEKTFDQASIGHSISVNGICLTVKEKHNKSLIFDVSPETISRSTFDLWKSGLIVNLEQSLMPNSPLGGHFVQGHVDCLTNVLEIKNEGSFQRIAFKLPKNVSAYIVEKGPVAVDGMSLTVASCNDHSFEVAVIPETIRRTNIKTYKPGTMVNIEADLLAKYIEKILNKEKSEKNKGFYSEEKLKKLGYI